jgi:hypothetical protein
MCIKLDDTNSNTVNNILMLVMRILKLKQWNNNMCSNKNDKFASKRKIAWLGINTNAEGEI